MKKFITVLLCCFISLIFLSANIEAYEEIKTVYIPFNETSNASQAIYHYKEAFEVLHLVNELRSSVGVEPLVMEMTMLEAAMRRSIELSVYFDHFRPNGEFFTTIGDEVGGHVQPMSENIASEFLMQKKFLMHGPTLLDTTLQ